MYRIVEWEKWQNYRKDRGQPPWIKLHRRLLRNSKWIDLTDAERGQLIAMWILAADHHGEIDMPLEKIQRVCFMSGKINIKKFIELGFICQDGVNVASTWRQGDAPKAETETETETEAEGEPAVSRNGSLPKVNGTNRKPKKNLTEWPEDFTLTDHMRQYAISQGVGDPDQCFEDFHNKALAKGYRNKDWVRAWYSWVRSPLQEKVQGGGFF